VIDVDVVILGSGSPIPAPDRAGPSTLVRTSAGDLLFDAGRGVLLRATAAASGAIAFASVFLTHLHSDHTTDLNDLITTRWAMSFTPNPLTVVGPVGTAALVAATEAMLELDIGYRLAHHDDLSWRPDTRVVEVTDGVVFEEGDVRVTAAPTDHAPVHPTAGYRVDDGDRSVVIAGDTVPCEGLDRLAAGADVLVHTVVRRDQIEALGLPRLIDVLDYHSAVGDAAATAERAGVATLVLTHMVPPVQPGAGQEWIDQARVGFSGAIVLAEDLTTIGAAPAGR
jgi:ribonuclease Z